MAVNAPAADSTRPTRPANGLTWIRRGVPTALVLAGLVVLGYWGHRSDWKFFLPAAHHDTRANEQRTIFVDAGPAGVSAGVCKEHQLPGCPTCNPKLAQLRKPPRSTADDLERARRAMAVRERVIGDPSPLNLPRQIRFASAESAEAAGIDIAPAWTEAVAEVVDGSGELGFDPTLYARLTTRAPGTAWRVFKRIGDAVQKGDVVALVDAAEVGKVKAELQVALVYVRLKAQAAKDIANAPVQERQRKEAEAALREAEIRLLAAEQALVNLGFAPQTADLRKLSPADVADRLGRLGLPNELKQESDGVPLPGTLLPILAPREGIVLRADIVAGEPLSAGKVLFVVADPRQLRLTLQVHPDDARWVRVGQSVRCRADGGTSEAMGSVSSIGVNADETTRKVPVWVEVPNPDGRLRASALGTGKIVLREEAAAVVVPANAIQTIAGVAVVFVRDKDYFESDGAIAYHVRVVMVGARTADKAEILAGLLAGEVVVSKGTALLADELRKSLAAEK